MIHATRGGNLGVDFRGSSGDDVGGLGRPFGAAPTGLFRGEGGEGGLVPGWVGTSSKTYSSVLYPLMKNGNYLTLKSDIYSVRSVMST